MAEQPNKKPATTQPANAAEQPGKTHLVIEPVYVDPITRALYVHRDYDVAREDWEAETHIPPVDTDESFGDVSSFVTYVKAFAKKPHLTWTAHGLKAVTDYHTKDAPDRCQWTADHPFVSSPEWTAWMRIASGEAIAHAKAVEVLEDRAEDIQEPDAAALMGILRNLRANVTATAQTELREDGTAAVSFSQDKTLRNPSPKVEIPPAFKIAIPVLKGHTDTNGKSVKYTMSVRVRVSIDNAAHLTFRFSIPLAEKVQEEVFAERVAEAKTLLGNDFTLLRGA